MFLPSRLVTAAQEQEKQQAGAGLPSVDWLGSSGRGYRYFHPPTLSAILTIAWQIVTCSRRSLHTFSFGSTRLSAYGRYT